MATNITPIALTSTITESISLNGHTYGNTITKTTALSGEVIQRVSSVATSETTLLTLSTIDSAGQIVGDDLKYIRITNLDDTNYIQLIFYTAAEHFSLKLDPNDSFVIMSNQMVAEADITMGTLEDMTSIGAKANGTACDIELIAITE